MKRSALFLLASVAVLAGCSSGGKFTVRGTLDDVRFPAADSVRIAYETMEKPLQAAVLNNAFTIKGTVAEPTIAKLSTVGTERRNTRVFILEKGEITFRDGQVSGTPLNDSTQAFMMRLSDISKQYAGQQEELRKAIEGEYTAFVSRHPNDPCAIYAIMIAYRRVNPAFLLKLIESTSASIRNDMEIHPLYTRLKMMSRDE